MSDFLKIAFNIYHGIILNHQKFLTYTRNTISDYFIPILAYQIYPQTNYNHLLILKIQYKYGPINLYN